MEAYARLYVYTAVSLEITRLCILLFSSSMCHECILSTKRYSKTWLKRLLYFVVIAIIAAFTIMELNQYPVDDTSQDAKYEQSIYNNPKIHYYSINRDNMPVKALYKQRDYCYNREDNTVILSGNADILSETKKHFIWK